MSTDPVPEDSNYLVNFLGSFHGRPDMSVCCCVNVIESLSDINNCE